MALGFPVEARHGTWLPWRTGLLVVAALMAAAMFGPAPSAWVFDAQLVGQGEWWRLVTGHWVHSDVEHAAWNIAALAVLGALFERRLGNGMLVALAVGTLGVDAWLLTGLSAPDAYCGLSGILNSLLAAGLLALGRERPHPSLPGRGCNRRCSEAPSHSEVANHRVPRDPHPPRTRAQLPNPSS